ncbi:SRPBCC domain-containing protein [Cohnella sp. GbtcB17]|uniref:SRPBCC family protein n=1 Tax=Cohnella sp. GbtcB17 TaxID=2824762 RepID=UPI001C30272A|nr:SRPBCC domain-containing protein [Cohnella sp. GbtcB17]
MSNARKLPDIVRTLELNAPIEKVWKMVSTAEGISAWFMPPNDFEPVVGHEFTINAGQFGMSPCKVTAFDPPERFAINWGKDWTLSFELKALSDSRTAFTLTHGGWDEDTLTEFGQPHGVIRGHMASGWDGIVAKLQRLVEA